MAESGSKSGVDQLFFNGIDGSTGGYLLPPLSVVDLARLISGQPTDDNLLRGLQTKAAGGLESVFAPMPGLDAADLAQVGWGVIFPARANATEPDPRREALRELLEWRQEQAARTNPKFYQEFSGPRGFRPKDDAASFMERLHVDYSQPVDPELGVPFYLLLVASPEEIPYSAQYQLDLQFAVGRIHFDTLEEYAHYARSVVRAEKREVRVARSAVFFGVRNADDPATQLSAQNLVAPLGKKLQEKLASGSQPPWQISTLLAEQATKSQLAQALGGTQTPALLFTASHGMGFPKDDPRQLPHQGALLCQDWPGPRAWRKPIDPGHYFAADDVPDDASLAGMIAFHFACYGAGTPELDEFAHGTAAGRAGTRPQIAPHPFVAALPRRLLGHPRGGALAVVGHVERAWGYSFQSPQAGPQLQAFEATLSQLMQGQPVGLATDFFNGRYAALAARLAKQLEDQKFGQVIPDQQLAGLWTAHNDARSYVVLGDPAVRLPLVGPDERPNRPPASGGHPIAITGTPPGEGGPGSSPRPAAGAADSRPPSRTRPQPTPGPGGRGPVFDATPAKPEATALSDAFLRQVAQTTQRVDQATTEGVSYDVGGGNRMLARTRILERLRWRLQQLGIPETGLESLDQGGVSFRPVTGDEEGATPAADLLLERILGRNDMVAAPRFLEAGLRASKAVARLRLQAASGKLLGWGTGSLIAPRLLLTNNHVLPSAEAARTCLAEFNVEEPLPGQATPSVPFELRPNELFLTDVGLDFTLVAVAPQSTTGRAVTEFGFNPPHAGDDPILESEKVNIIQHPAGRPKELALRDNTVTAILADFIHYEADTEPGSSGSPVFNDQWQLVALHHSGVPRKDAAGNWLLRDGTLWQKGMSDQLIDWVANEGVRLSRILAWVHNAPLATPEARALRDELRGATPGDALNPPAAPASPVPLVSAPPPARTGPNGFGGTGGETTAPPGSSSSNTAPNLPPASPGGPAAPSGNAGPAPTASAGPALAQLGSGGVIKITLPIEITLALGDAAAGGVNGQVTVVPQSAPPAPSPGSGTLPNE